MNKTKDNDFLNKVLIVNCRSTPSCSDEIHKFDHVKCRVFMGHCVDG